MIRLMTFLGIAAGVLGFAGMLAVLAGQAAYGVALCAMALGFVNTLLIVQQRAEQADE